MATINGRLLICLLTVLLFGCSKVYECDLYLDSDCTSYLDTISFKGYTEEDAEGNCMEYEFHIRADTTFYPQCCECSSPTLAIFGSDYVN